MTTAIQSKYQRHRAQWTPEQWAVSLAKVTAWNAANPERTAESRWRGNIRRRYGVTAEWYFAQLEAQGGVCAVCREPEMAVGGSGRTKRLAVDHDHRTGRVRGLLCMRCNHTLGRHGDDPNHLEAMAAYLRAGEGEL